MTVSFDAGTVKKLRETTGAGMMDCKKALTETSGDFEKAIDFLRKKGIETANKKSSREAKEGIIQTYIHQGSKIGVMVEINCETDFVARNEDFQQFSRDVAMHIAAVQPKYVKGDEVPEDFIAKEKEIFREQVGNKPEHVMEKILEGKVAKLKEEVCLLEQPFVKDQDKTVGGYLTEIIAKIGENIVIKRFARFQVGE